jgi:hypothetical protein
MRLATTPFHIGPGLCLLIVTFPVLPKDVSIFNLSVCFSLTLPFYQVRVDVHQV